MAMKRERFELPRELVIEGLSKSWFRVYDIFLRSDVDEWCRAERIKYWKLAPQAFMLVGQLGTKMMVGNPAVTMRTKDAIYFKLKWF
jgi:hypothetical protein